MKYLLKIIIFCFSPIFIFTKNTTDSNFHSLTLYSAFQNPNFSDYLVTPYYTSGLGGNIQIIYEYDLKYFHFSTGLKGGGGKLSSGFSSFNDVDFFAEASIYMDASYKFPILDNKGIMLTGIRTDYLLDFLYLGHMTTYDWVGDLSLLPSIEFQYQFDKSRIIISYAISLFSIVNRPPWTIYDGELDYLLSDSPELLLLRGEPSLINNYIRMNSSIHWELNLTSSFHLMTGASFNYIKTTIPQNAVFFTTSIDIGVKYLF